MAARLALTLALLTLLCGGARAQQYQRLHVRSFTLTSSTSHPQLESPFRVTLTIRVDENLAQLNNVFLPTFTGAEDLGDERQLTHSAHGSIYRETLDLVAHQRGPITITPAYLDAIDARDGTPKRFLSNALQLNVGGGPIEGGVRWLFVLIVVPVLLALAVVVAASRSALARKNVIITPPQTPAVPAPAAAVPAVDPLKDALDCVRSRRDRSSVLHLRSVLWNEIGAGEGETLGDVLRRPGAAGPRQRLLLHAIERAAFIEDARLPQAISDLLAQWEEISV